VATLIVSEAAVTGRSATLTKARHANASRMAKRRTRLLYAEGTHRKLGYVVDVIEA
jgi:hypothetical protein